MRRLILTAALAACPQVALAQVPAGPEFQVNTQTYPFGIGMPAKIAFGAIHGVVPIAIFTLGAVRNLNPVYVKAARVMRLTPWRIASRVLLPGAIPEIFTGIRIGFSLTLIGTLLGEMFASQRGIGHLLIQAIGLHNIKMIVALTLLLVIIAVAASAMLLAVDRRLRRYSV